MVVRVFVNQALTLGVLASLRLFDAAPASAQDPRLSGRLDERTLASVTAVIDSVAPLGIPAEPLVLKALEGRSKGAPGPRIVAAVRALAADLARARDALGVTSSAPELVAGAAALRAGAEASVLSRLRLLRPRESVAVHLAVLADLVASGVPADTASSAVLALARASLRDAELVAFRQSVERDIALGAPAGAATAARLNAGPRSTDGTLGTGAPEGPTTPPRPRRP
jgi:hypothetical protein